MVASKYVGKISGGEINIHTIDRTHRIQRIDIKMCAYNKLFFSKTAKTLVIRIGHMFYFMRCSRI